ncbi:MAG: polymer-forming cytoskeletal protein [Armatimonadetes bacterium]|nr:polymer-forming cytoskeletal protein [Anaerolineae bacterium]
MGLFGNRRQPEPEPQPIPDRIPITQPSQPQPTQSNLPTPQQPIGFETVLGANAEFDGKFTSSANVRIDGVLSGSLEIHGNVLVGETAKINADIHARNISIAGAVRGNVTGKKVQLLRTGRVWGDITATALTTEEGAFIDGRIAMVSQEAVALPPLKIPDAPLPTPELSDLPDEPIFSTADDEPDTSDEPDFLINASDSDDEPAY